MTLAVYSVTGEFIRNLTSDEFHAPGTYEITWNGNNNFGEKVSSGLYIYRFTTPTLTASNKMMLIK